MVALHFQDIDVNGLIHNRVNLMNRPYSIIRKARPYHNAGKSVLDRFFCVHWSLLFVSWSPNKSTRNCPSIQHDFALVRPQYISPHSAICSAACLIVKSGSFLELQVFKLFSRSRMVLIDAGIFYLF